jgi:hypothetical protein
MTEFLDSGVKDKLIVYITPDEIVQIHHSLVEHKADLPTVQSDPLVQILEELGTPPPQNSAAKGPGCEIVLHLSSRFTRIEEDKDAPIKHIMQETKRMLLLIVRFSNGNRLLDILENPCTESQERDYFEFVSNQDLIISKRKGSLHEIVSEQSLARASVIAGIARSPSIREDVAPNTIMPFYKREDGSMYILYNIE